MKRSILTILFVSCLAMMATAQTSRFISKNVYGFRLGETTRLEAIARLQSQGLKVVDEISEITVENVGYDDEVWDELHLTFDSTGVLNTLGLIDKAPASIRYNDVEKKLKNKYGPDSDANADVLFNLLLAILIDEADGTVSHSYCKKNNDIMVSLAEFTDKGIFLFYMIGADQLEAEAKQFIRELDKDNPNYDPVNKVESVCGVKFGEPKSTAMQAFSRRSQSLLRSNTNEVIYSQVSVGGITYDRATLYFKYNKQKGCEVLIAASFDSNFPVWDREKAKRFFQNVCSLYRGKYTNETMHDQDPDDMVAGYGMYQDDYTNGDYPPITVTMRKSLSSGGNMYYYVTVNYFQQNAMGLYNDEI